MRIALYQPEIAQNVGAVLRLGACFGVAVDLIEPMGFAWDDRRVRRTAMDYIDAVSIARHAGFAAFRTTAPGRLILLSTKGNRSPYDFAFMPGAAPLTVANFLDYLTTGKFLNTIFHRSVPGFIIQAGAFRADATASAVLPSPAVVNEPKITNLRGTCDENGAQIISTASFDVVATRRDASQPREVVLPFYNVVMQGGNRIVAKKIGAVALNFAAGSLRAQTSSRVVALVDRASTSLPEDVRRELTRKRKTGDADAAVDPLSDPKIRDAVARATFEHLVGFQLSQDQLRYNATR